MKKIPSLLANLSLLVLSILLALGVTEATLPYLDDFAIEEAVYQVRRPVVQYMYGEFHPQLQYILKKNLKEVRLSYEELLDYTVDTNSYGFRGPEWDLSDKRRNIVILGDSFAFGWGVAWEETLGQILEKKLREIDSRFQVVNIAMSGYSIKDVINAFEHFREKLRPEAVIYVFCPNDLGILSAEEARSGAYRIEYRPEPGDEEMWETMRIRNQPDYWTWDKFRRGSYLHALYARYVRPILSTRIRESLHRDEPPRGFDFPPPLDDARHTGSDEAKFLVFCLNRLARQVDGALFLVPTSDKTILARRDNEENPRWVLREFSAGHDRTFFIDFERLVRLTPDGGRFFFSHDDHWTPAGHELAAQSLFDTMRQEMLQ